MSDDELAAWYLRAVTTRKGFIGVICRACHRPLPESAYARENSANCQCGETTEIAEAAHVHGLPPEWFVELRDAASADIEEIVR